MAALSLGTGVDADVRRRPRPPAPGPGAPALLAAPRLVGSGRIGTPVLAEPGRWSGAPTLGFRWLRDGAAIPGATGATYTPGPADDRRQLACRITATNAAGSAGVLTGALPITHVPPRSGGVLPDVRYSQHSGFQTVNAAPDFTGEALTFGVSGAGVSVDPATGLVSIPTEALREGVEVTVTAHNSGGTAMSHFRVTVAAQPADPLPVAPVMTDVPELSGNGKVGSEVVADPGIWTGVPAPTLALQWLRDGAEIPGATWTVYVPRPEDDLTDLALRVTATNAAGSAEAQTAPLAITHVGPVVVDLIDDLVLSRGSGPRTVEAAHVFAGAALTYAVTGAVVDVATGRITLSTEALRTEAEVTVTAGNSGGTAAVSFRVTVVPALAAPAALGAPRLTGSGRIGAPVNLEPGSWSGNPAPALGFAWLRDGAAIPGATGGTYLPVAADDLRGLSARVTARNSQGAAAVETAPLAVTWPAPTAAGALPDLTCVQGSGPRTVEAAAAFAGGGLRYSVTGVGASIDVATGRVTLSTDALRTSAEVAVTAANSGGAATGRFRVTVAAPLAPPTAAGTLADVSYAQGSGVKTVSAQAGFSGAELAFALTAAPAGVTINAGSGLVSIPTTALLAAATITVRASNAAGSATQSFRVTVRSIVTVFDASTKLGDVSFVFETAAPAWSHDAGGFARLVPATAGRVHGAWSKAAGDGLYRCLARWTAANATAAGYSPALLGGRIAKTGANFTGAYIEFFQPSSGARRFRAHQFTGSGATVTLLQSVSPGWEWNTWYWIDLELDGPSLRGRFYPETAPAPAWQLQATIAATGLGGFGPGGQPRNGGSPQIDIKRLEYRPPAGQAPAAAQDVDWTLGQVGVL